VHCSIRSDYIIPGEEEAFDQNMEAIFGGSFLPVRQSQSHFSLPLVLKSQSNLPEFFSEHIASDMDRLLLEGDMADEYFEHSVSNALNGGAW
jgi:hypothetical protein